MVQCNNWLKVRELAEVIKILESVIYGMLAKIKASQAEVVFWVMNFSFKIFYLL